MFEGVCVFHESYTHCPELGSEKLLEGLPPKLLGCLSQEAAQLPEQMALCGLVLPWVT